MGGLILLSGKGDLPDWMYGGRTASARPAATWIRRAPVVAFHHWGREAFEQAKREGKLVLLFLGPAYNAPTAQMAAETFGDAQVAALVSARFVPVRVDASQSPDVDLRYRAGGWPTTSILTARGAVVEAATFLSAKDFLSWAGAVSGKARAEPEIVARADARAAQFAAEEPARLNRRAAVSSQDALSAARERLSVRWNAGRRSFDGDGPRFAHWDTIAALSRLHQDWSDALAREAAKGALALSDPRGGGMRRAAAPDGSVVAFEKTADDQAAALGALCELDPGAARGLLNFIRATMSTQSSSPRYVGWLSGYDDAMGDARPSDEAQVARAVLSCPEAAVADSAFARKVARRLHDAAPGKLLQDEANLGRALVAAGDVRGAETVFLRLENHFSAGAAYFDRLTTGELPPALDRMTDALQNATAFRFLAELSRALPRGARRTSVCARAERLRGWLAATSDALDPAVWAELASVEIR
jgi:hypothetical protein